MNEGEPQLETPQTNTRLARYYTEAKETVLSDEITAFVTSTFTKRLSKEVWSDLMQKYPPIKGMEEVLVAPTMETGTREYIKQKFGYNKTKEVFTSDDGLVEKQAPFLAVARPIAAALDLLEEPPNPDESDGNGPDPDEIKAYLKDALALLGNANFRLNAWRQKRFWEFLTDVGKRILKEDIPTDKHLFPDKFHHVVQSEHDHSKTNSKVIAAPSKPQFPKAVPRQPFRAFSGTGASGSRSGENVNGHTRPMETKKQNPVASRPTKLPSLSDKECPRTPAPLTTADYMIPRLNKITLPEQQIAGRLRHFLGNWKIITSDESVLETVKGYQIPLTSKPHQWRKRITKAKGLQQEVLLTQAISDLVSKGAVHQVVEQEDQFLSCLNTVHNTAGEQESTGFQPEDTEQTCQNRKVQTGKFGFSENHAETERLSDEIRLEGRILLSSNCRGTPEVPSILISCCDLRIPVSTLRVIVSSSSLHETSQASDCHPEDIWHTNSDLYIWTIYCSFTRIQSRFRKSSRL